MTRTWNEIDTMIKTVKQQQIYLSSLSSSFSSSSSDDDALSFPDTTHVYGLIQSLLNDLGDSVWNYPELLSFLDGSSTSSSSSVIVRYQIQMMNHQVLG